MRSSLGFSSNFSTKTARAFLLRIALDVEGDLDAQQPWLLLEFLDEDSQSIGQFVMQGSDGFLSNDLGGEKSLGLIGHLVFRKIRLVLGEKLENFVDQGVQSCSFERRDGNDCGEVELFPETIDHRQELSLRNGVNFIQNKDGLSGESLRFLKQHGIGLRRDAAGVHDEQKDIDALNRRGHFTHHLPAERGIRVVQSRRIDENDLAALFRHDALNAISRGLRFGGDDGDLLTNKPVEQRGFARIWPADDSDEPGARIALIRFGFCRLRRHGLTTGSSSSLV